LNGKDRELRVGNIWAGVSYLPDCSCGLSRLTLGVGAPSARADSAPERQALRLAAGQHGNWDAYLWTPDLFPLVFGYQTLLPLGRGELFRLRGEGDVAIGLPGGQRDSEVGLQWRGEAAVGRMIEVGAWMSAVYWPTFDSGKFQSALATFVRYGTRDTSVGAELVMNLDSPMGFAFVGDGVWSVQLSWLSSL